MNHQFHNHPTPFTNKLIPSSHSTTQRSPVTLPPPQKLSQTFSNFHYSLSAPYTNRARKSPYSSPTSRKVQLVIKSQNVPLFENKASLDQRFHR
jgi:hypothetical protein